MADSFADLWSSSAPTKQTETRTLGALSSTGSQNVRKPADDVFSMLASAGSSSSVNSRSATPSHAGRTQIPSLNASGAKPLQKTPSTESDAFSSLLSPSFVSNSRNGANMTIAERAAQVERQRIEQLQKSNGIRRPEPEQHASAWAGLDALGGGNTTTIKSQGRQTGADDWMSTFTAPINTKPGSSNPPSIAKRPAPDDDWGLDDFVASPPAASRESTQKPSSTLLDLDPFSPSASEFNKTSSKQPSPRSNSPADFDFGNREDGLLNDHSDHDDDILGDLGKPVDQVRAPPKSPSPRPPPGRQSPPSPPAQGSTSRSVSPPPHIVGQIVEMGFSPQQARIALAATDTGLDVQAALENLLSNGVGSTTPPVAQDGPQRPDRRQPPHRDSDSDHDIPPQIRRPSRRVDSVQRETPPLSDAQRNLQDQADRLLAQASEIGLSMFNRANAFWKEGKEKVQKAYEERAAASARSTPPQGTSSRPRWMQDGSDHDDDDTHHGGGFRDDDDDHDEVLPPRPDPEPRRDAGSRSKPPPQVRESRQPPAPERSSVGNLLSDDAPTVYVSPFRRKAPSRSQVQPTIPQSAPQKATPTPPRAPSPIQLVQRKTISASPSAIATSLKHKDAGTEMYKLGRYAEAETHYSSAISVLPESHLLLVPLYNNRALTRIKTGDHSGAVEDCTAVVTLIGASYHPTREAKVTKEDEGSSVDLGDGLVKALRRRAEAYEGKEKWDAARQDWETIAGTEWAGKLRNEAVRGAGRCRRMLTANPDGPSMSAATPVPPRPKPKPKAQPVQRGPTPPSDALNRVREANAAAEAEDQLKHDLKDSIDARLLAWKGGKETNIRALIASLETVLWPELGWQKVGMHELVTPNQVKIRYTKAIAKLHPDKLNANNTTLEQRMIANGVFGSLSDAWTAFKQ